MAGLPAAAADPNVFVLFVMLLVVARVGCRHCLRSIFCYRSSGDISIEHANAHSTSSSYCLRCFSSTPSPPLTFLSISSLLICLCYLNNIDCISFVQPFEWESLYTASGCSFYISLSILTVVVVDFITSVWKLH